MMQHNKFEIVSAFAWTTMQQIAIERLDDRRRDDRRWRNEQTDDRRRDEWTNKRM